MRSIALVSVLFVACNGGLSASPNPTRGDGLGVGDACASTSQCGGGLKCENGACAVKVGDPDDLDAGEQEHVKDGGEDEGEHLKDGGHDRDGDGDDDDDDADGGEHHHGHHDDGGED